MKTNTEFIVYEDSHIDSLINLCELNNLKYAYIIHDHDIKETGELKAAHYHFLLFSHEFSFEELSLLTSIPLNLIQKVHNKKAAIRYLIHADSPDKYQYNIKDIVSNLNISTFFSFEIENENARYLFQFIISQKHFLSYANLTLFAFNNGLYSYLRRNASWFRNIVDEHNLKLRNKY